MTTKIFTSHDQMSRSAAEFIAGYINEHPDALLCLAAGETPLQTFAELIEMQRRLLVNLSTVYYVSLDEWWGFGYDTKGSCVQVMTDSFYDPAAIPAGRRCLFNGLAADIEQEKERVSCFIRERGGVSLILLGVGMNGHVGFLEPHQLGHGVCVDVPLDDITREVSVKYFGLQLNPQKGISVGFDTMQQADRVLLMMSGERKAEIARKALLEPPTEAVPASMLAHCDRTLCFLDQAAAVKLGMYEVLR